MLFLCHSKETSYSNTQLFCRCIPDLWAPLLILFSVSDSLHFVAFSGADSLCSVLLWGRDNVLPQIHWKTLNVPILHLKQQEIGSRLSQNIRHFWILWVNFIQRTSDVERYLDHFFFLVTLIVFSCCFRLYLKGHSGTAGKQSSLILHGAEFSTKDADNDNCMCKCALMLTGGEYNNPENMWYVDRNLLFF